MGGMSTTEGTTAMSTTFDNSPKVAYKVQTWTDGWGVFTDAIADRYSVARRYYANSISERTAACGDSGRQWRVTIVEVEVVWEAGRRVTAPGATPIELARFDSVEAAAEMAR